MLCIGTTSCGFTFYLFFITIHPVRANLLHLQTDIVKKNKVLTEKTILNYVTCQKYMYMYTDFQVLSFFPEVIVILILLPLQNVFQYVDYTLWKNEVITTYLKRSKQYNSYHVVTAILFNFLSSNIVTQILFTGALVTLQPKPKIRLP